MLVEQSALYERSDVWTPADSMPGVGAVGEYFVNFNSEKDDKEWDDASGKPRRVTAERVTAYKHVLTGTLGCSDLSEYKKAAFSLAMVTVKERSPDAPSLGAPSNATGQATLLPKEKMEPGGDRFQIECLCKKFTHSFVCRHVLAVESVINGTIGTCAAIAKVPVCKEAYDRARKFARVRSTWKQRHAWY